MRFHSRMLRLAGAAIVAVSSLAFSAFGEEKWPTRPIAIVVPYTPGGIASTFVRLQADLLEPILGQPVLTENVPGGGGLIAAEKVARSTPDGYTWMSIQSGLMTITPHVTQGFDPAKELKLVATSRTQPMLFVVRRESPYQTVHDIVEDARKRPGQVSYGSLGINSLHHIIGEALADLNGVELLHVPYTGSAQYVVDLLSGRVDFVISTAATMAGYGDQLRALGSAQQAKSTLAPNVPTSAEYGMPELDFPSWVGVAVPKDTPQEIIDTIDAALARIDVDPKFREQMVKFESEPFYVSGKEFQPRLEEHSHRIRSLLEKMNKTKGNSSEKNG